MTTVPGGETGDPGAPAPPSGTPLPTSTNPDEWGYRALARSLATSDADRSWFGQVIDFINARLDLADHHLLVLLKLELSAGGELPDDLRAQLREAVLGFRYGLTEPGRDHMCTWTENHQLLFATCEYLAGQLYPTEVFTNDGRRGTIKRERARAVLGQWLEDRFHHGFSEWLSNTYYELLAGGLTLLVDHAEDEELATRAAMVLDLLMLDLALHRFDGHFQASGGRVYRSQKMHPETAEIETILADAFVSAPRFDHTQVSGIFLTRERYRVPEVIRQIARADGARLIRTSQGRDVGEAMGDVERRTRGVSEDVRFLDQVRTAWGQQAYVTPETITLTMKALERYDLAHNRFLAPLVPFTRVPRGVAQRTLLRTVNPIVTGISLHRANVTTYRTPNYLISSAQSYRPGEFGDQQHLWQASLPGGINIFSTHPGSTQLAGEARPTTPSAWVGNGVNPDVGQVNNVVLVLHDLRSRRGYLEGRRHEFSHLFFPFVKFDETKLGARSVAGRVGTTLVGVLALERLEMVSQVELIQRGQVTGWVLVASELSEFGSLGQFVSALKRATIRHTRNRLVVTMTHSNSPRDDPAPHTYELGFGTGFRVDGVGQNPHHWRYDTDWVQAPRGADEIVVRGEHQSLRLAWNAGVRAESHD